MGGALGAAVLLLVIVLGRVSLRSDMADFLPAGRTDAARLVLAEVRAGSATGLLLMGIEGAPPDVLARVSRAMAARLRMSGLFTLVAGGEDSFGEAEEQFLFRDRYLLSPAVTAEAFTVSGLRAGLEGVLRLLRSSAAPLGLRYGLPDPPGAFLALLRGWAGDSPVRQADGAWFAADRPPGQDRAILLARTRAGGMDIPAQDAATAAIESAFAAADPGPARLLLAGPAVFARDAARAIRGDVERISVLSTILVALLLWWRFRSPLVVAAIAAPVVASVAVAACAVQLLFGSVHGVALGFGSTMLGVSVDYPVLLIGHRKRGEPAGDTRARIGRAFVPAVLTATLGLAGMVFSGFPGLAQLGVFAAVGLLAAAGFTWVLLPRLVIAAELAPVSAGNPAWLARVEGWRRWRWLGLAAVGVSALGLAAMGGPRWQGDLQALSPVPAASLALDRELRASLGAAEAGQLILVSGPDAETVLRRQEALIPALDRLRAAGAIGGAELAARLLPSAATQEARRALLPPPEELDRRLDEARAGLPFRPEALRPFADAVAASRTLPPLRPEELARVMPDGAFATRLAPLLFQRDGAWHGPVALRGVRDPGAVADALRGTAGAAFLDMRAELGGILSEYMRGAWRSLAWAGLLVLAVLAAALRDPGRVARVLGAVAAAILAAVAALTAAGEALSLIHLVALQLVAGVGLDYALFFARRQLDEEERARTLRTLVTCNAMTLLTFGLLAACQTPILRDIGVTVAAGAVAAMAFAFLFAGQAPGEEGR